MRHFRPISESRFLLVYSIRDAKWWCSDCEARLDVASAESRPLAAVVDSRRQEPKRVPRSAATRNTVEGGAQSDKKKCTRFHHSAFTFLVLVYLLGNYSVHAVSQTFHDLNWVLIWSDDFEKDGLPDADKWSYDEGDGCPSLCGWGNNELQYYTVLDTSTAKVEDGILILQARASHSEDKPYYSAKLKSNPEHAWKYGKFLIRAKLPYGVGIWPAIWMLPLDWKYGGWPESGEIDIMEHVGFSPDTVFGTVHTGAFNHMKQNHKSGFVNRNDFSDRFYEYYIIWTEEFIEFGLEGEPYFTYYKESEDPMVWPFDQSFYLILNVAVGGNWGGKEGVDTSIFPQKMEIDYVRVYQKQ